MAKITTVKTSLPKCKSDNKSILSAAKIWLKDNPQEFALFERFLSSSRTEFRYFTMPPEEVVSMGSAALKAQVFEREAPYLTLDAVKKSLESSNLKAESIDAIISTSCSCPIIPALDTILFEELPFRRNILRIPAYQYGCAGGIIGLGLASTLSSSLKNILLVSTELCSLVFQPTNHSASHLVGAAIFGDGAACTIIQSEATEGLEIIDHQSYLLPNSRHLMGYDIQDTGSHLRLDKELPSHLVKAVPELVDRLLKKHSLTRKDVPWWLFHPGGTKILNFLDEVLGLSPEQSHWAGDILHSVGNLSSATILFVINSFMESNVAKSGDNVLIVGVGPGLTIEIVLARQS